jgi:NAD-dependent SIR2 family protein deacetylase
MPNQFNVDLVRDVARRRVVVFAGAGVSASAVLADGKRMPEWEAFLSGLLKDLPASKASLVKQALKDRDYLLASELLQRILEDKWEEKVVAEFGKAAEPSDLHRSIVTLDPNIILTTNFDRLLENSYVKIPSQYTSLPLTVNQIDENTFKVLKDFEQRYIIKIHGTVDQADKLTFSQSEYIKYAYNNQSYISFIESLLLNYTFVFLGFSMKDPAICQILERYAFKYPRARPHYFFAAKPINSEFRDVQKSLRKLVIVDYDKKNHHAELPRLINELADQARTMEKELAADVIRRLSPPASTTSAASTPV